KDLGIVPSDLRSEHAEPYFLDFFSRRPELQKILKVSPALHHLRGYCAMNGHLVTGDVLENAIVGGGPAPQIMLRLKSVHRDYDINPWDGCPVRGNRPEGARDHLRMNTANRELRKNRLEFPISHQWIAAHNGKMQGPKLVHQGQNSQYQVPAFIVGELAQAQSFPRMAKL